MRVGTLFMIAVAALVAISASPQRALAKKSIPVKQKDVEVVFVLDTTSSMSGLIQGAKQKIWFVANEILKAKQNPHLKIGLVAFRDKNDEYVTKVLPLTDDLDNVYATLMAFQVGGGGDFEEDVNAGLQKAVKSMTWSKSKDTLKMIFLVGDAPPHMDYNEVTHQTLSSQAIRQNIYINTLQCGSDARTTTAWQTIARNSEGRFAAIPQDGGMKVAAATPYDEELGKLAVALDKTYVDYGSQKKRAAKADFRFRAGGLAQAAPSSIRAERALAKSKAGASKEEDLVALLEKGEGEFDKVDVNQLNDGLKEMSAPERKAHVAQLSKNRKEISKKIAEIEKSRASYIKDLDKAASNTPSGFDVEVIAAIRHQAKAKGLVFE